MDPRQLRALVCAVVVALTAVLVIGCGASSSGSSGTSSASPSASAAAAAAAAAQTMMDAIVKGQFEEVGMKPVSATVVRSEEAKDFYFVAVKFQSSEGEQVGVWTTKYPDGTTLIWSVNDVAQNTTQWPVSTSAEGEKITMDTQGAQEAVDALQ
jgi:hypothetical protein